MQISKELLPKKTEQIYDAIVIGGGAGGLSAGIYLKRYMLSTLIIDKGKARSFWMQELHNYLGLPSNTTGRSLLKTGKEHYLSLDGDFLNGFVEEVIDEGETFAIRVKFGRQNSVYPVFRCKYLIAASGIIDYLPQLEDMRNVYEFAGHNLHVCLICDGYEMTDQVVGVFVGSNEVIPVAYSVGWFTPYVKVFTNGLFEVSPENRQKLKEHGYPLFESPVQKFLGDNHQMDGVELEDGSVVELQSGVVSMGSKYHANYLENFDLEHQGGNLVTDKMARTSHPRIFAIGDLKVGLNQVIIAAADGALAATQIWREIRREKGAQRWAEGIKS
ncbi:MAG: NAD(P)/FAD-dependent oxidoreductase [Calothrix sp. MO_167.B42]|nr:NAD(P)/FAD-dependent oxidoreductase [Calothrix sp. MO_167.B42]